MKGSKPQLADISLVPLCTCSRVSREAQDDDEKPPGRVVRSLPRRALAKSGFARASRSRHPWLPLPRRPPLLFCVVARPCRAGRLTCASQLISRRALRASRKRVSSRRVPSSRECFHQLSTRLLILGFLNPPLLRFSNQHNTWVVVVVVVVFFFWLVGFYHPRSLLPTICCHFDSAVFHMVLASGTVVVLLL